MFGNVPRPLWSKWCPPDEAGRILLCCRCLLVERGDQKILLETGIGSFFEPKLKERFGVVETEHVLCRGLEALGTSHEAIDAVVLSHLHFDHAGGLLKAYREGEAPALLFPRARFITSAGALARARDPHPRDRASFIPELLPLLEASGRLEVVEGEEGPLASLGDHLSFRLSHGHTPAMLHTLVRGAHGAVFTCADLVPGVPWAHLPVTMGYDRYPELLIDEKARWFPELAASGTWLFFTHDPETALAKLTQSDDRFRTDSHLGDAMTDLDLDAAPS